MPKPPQPLPQPPDPMQAMGKAKTIGAPQGPWTPLTTGGDSPLIQLAHRVFGNAQRDPNGGYAMTSQNMAGLIGGPGTTAETAASTAAGPIARFLGWGEHQPLYTVHAPGSPLHGSTMAPAQLQHHQIPFTPPPPPAPGPAAGALYDAQGMAVPPGYFNQTPTQLPTFTAKTGAEPGIANTYHPDLTSLLGGKGPGGKPFPPEGTSVMDKTMTAAKAPGKVIKTPRAIAEERAAAPVEPVTPASVAKAKRDAADELAAHNKINRAADAKDARSKFKAVQGGKPPEEFTKNYPDHTPEEHQTLWDAFKKSSLFPGSRFDK